jgi:hypothetical protein
MEDSCREEHLGDHVWPAFAEAMVPVPDRELHICSQRPVLLTSA